MYKPKSHFHYSPIPTPPPCPQTKTASTENFTVINSKEEQGSSDNLKTLKQGGELFSVTNTESSELSYLKQGTYI